MKKMNYMAPEMEIVELKSQFTLLAGSGETVDNPGSDPGTPGDY